jgi:uncharacterized protein (TIGR00290 family)
LKKALVSWSSGKDSAWALHLIRHEVEVVGLVTTVNEAFDRVAMHGVRRALLQAQTDSLGLPLWIVPLPWPCSNEQYEGIMAALCRRAASAGIDAVVFGDLYLADVREYRERQLRGTGIEPLFPLWHKPTGELARAMIAAGLRAKVVCLDPKVLPVSFAGRDFDSAFLSDLPAGVDPCGEKGEFHSFVYDGPVFRNPIPVSVGEVCERDGFVFADLCHAGQAPDVECQA